jgi:hypothetical protein
MTTPFRTHQTSTGTHTHQTSPPIIQDIPNIMDAALKSYTFTAPPFELPQRTRSRSRASIPSDLDSPHIHVGLKSTANRGSQSDLSTDSSSESAIDEATRQYLMQPRLGAGTSFEEFRMPAFSSLAHLGHDVNDIDIREFPSTAAQSRSYNSSNFRFGAARTRTNSLDAVMLGAPHGSLCRSSTDGSAVRRIHRTRCRNKAMDSRQFDDILDQVFIE